MSLVLATIYLYSCKDNVLNKHGMFVSLNGENEKRIDRWIDGR